MSRENPLWGELRIHGELQMLGFEIAEPTVSNYLVRTHRPSSDGRKTFLWNQAAAMASLDPFVVSTISFRLPYGLVILRHQSRRVISIAVSSNPTAEWIAGRVTDAFPSDEAPPLSLRNRDHAFGSVYTRRVRSMGIREHPVAACSPWQNGQVECLIGSIRRECLDHVIVFGEAQLRGLIRAYASYCIQI